jgi:hypothetical protein
MQEFDRVARMFMPRFLHASQGVLKLTKAEKDQRTEAAVSAALKQVVAFERQLYGKRILCAEDMFDALDRDKSGACRTHQASTCLVAKLVSYTVS